MIFFKKIVFVITFAFSSFLFSAQQKSNSEIVHSAISDELKRCIDSLKQKDCSPFFMDFGLSHTKSYEVLSTLGGVIFLGENGELDFSSRLMIGSYHFNDENFSSHASEEDNDELAIPYHLLPENPDYFSIRMALWGSAERIYRSACKTYKDKLNTLLNNNKSLDDYPLEDFSKEDTLVYIDNSNDDQVVKNDKWKQLACTLSAEFKNYPKIINSVVYIGNYASNYYFHNTEGTRVQFPIQSIKIFISAVARNEGESSAASSINFVGLTETDLPSVDSLLKATNFFASKLVEALSFPVIDEEYNGPILYEDIAASELFQSSLFHGNRFVASRADMSDSHSAFYLPDKPTANAFERKMDKIIVDKSLSVVSLPTLKNYKGQNMVGSYFVDAEGVKPSDSLVLIENGILKGMFNDRVPTFMVPKSTGHKQVYITRSGTRRAMGPGVIKINCTNGYSRKDLKAKLIEKAKNDDLDYAYIIRKGTKDSPFYSLYKVDLDNGAETPVRYFSIPIADIDNLKDNAFFGNAECVNNCNLGRSGFLSHQEGNRPGYSDGDGMPISIISPDAVLVDKQKLIVKTERDSYKTPIVPSPLGQ
ncbi:MAG: hypothetical protein JW717_11285 [Marinilabiliaceae bacterium]|nr:hypothetical protein [Marinilabiliaceae bacterium]